MGEELPEKEKDDYWCRCPDDESTNLMHVAYFRVLSLVPDFADSY